MIHPPIRLSDRQQCAIELPQVRLRCGSCGSRLTE